MCIFFSYRLYEMKAELEQELRQKEADLEARRQELSRSAEQKQLELDEKLSKEETEKKALQERLLKLEESKMMVEGVLRAELEKKELAEQRVEQLLTEAGNQSSSASSSCLENFEHLLESELQCSICSEPFITVLYNFYLMSPDDGIHSH